MKVIQKHHLVQYIQDHLLTVLFFAAIGIISLASCLTLLHSYVTKTAINNQATGTENALEADFSASILGKDMFLNLNGGVRRLLGQRRMNEVVKLNNGCLILDSDRPKDEDIQYSADAMKALQDKLAAQNIPMLYVMTPSKVSPTDPELPTGEVEYLNEGMDKLYAALDEQGVSSLDLRPAFEAYPGGYYALEFKTDHHWNMVGAFWAYKQIVARMEDMLDVEIPAALTDLDSYNITTYKDVEFGGYGQRTGIAFSGAEDFDLIEPDYDTDIVNVTTGETGSFTDVLTRKQELEANPEKFRKVVLYDYFFNKAFDTFSNQGTPCDKKLLIVGDSMTKALAPFFVLTFQNVKCLDAYSAKTTLTQQLLDEYQPDVVLFVHHATRLNSPDLYEFTL